MFDFTRLSDVFLVAAIISTVLYILKLVIFAFTGGDVEVETDFNNLFDSDTSFNFISIQSMLVFFMGFGWMGFILLSNAKIGEIISLIIAAVVGLLFMYFNAYLMFFIKKLDKHIEVKLEDYIGTEGRAYRDINPNSEGDIEIAVNNKLEIRKAFNLTNEKISAFTPIKIEKVENDVLYITKL